MAILCFLESWAFSGFLDLPVIDMTQMPAGAFELIAAWSAAGHGSLALFNPSSYPPKPPFPYHCLYSLISHRVPDGTLSCSLGPALPTP